MSQVCCASSRIHSGQRLSAKHLAACQSQLTADMPSAVTVQYLLSELSFRVNNELPPFITDALLELHYGLVRLPSIPGAVHLIRLAISAVASVLFN